MGIGEADALAVQAVEIGGVDPGVAVAGEIAVALVVREEENDVGRTLTAGGEESRRSA